MQLQCAQDAVTVCPERKPRDKGAPTGAIIEDTADAVCPSAADGACRKNGADARGEYTHARASVRDVAQRRGE